MSTVLDSLEGLDKAIMTDLTNLLERLNAELRDQEFNPSAREINAATIVRQYLIDKKGHDQRLVPSPLELATFADLYARVLKYLPEKKG